MQFGDRNTFFFHTQTVVRCKRNKIHGLFLEDGSYSANVETLKNEALIFYKNSFASSPQCDYSIF